MSRLSVLPAADRRRGWIPLAVFLFVAGMQLWLVAGAGTDIPFYDQWDIEGRWLYPTWIDGSFHFADLFRPFNEHRLVWTHALNLALFRANGQWDPLVQLVAIAILRAACAAGLVWGLGRALSWRGLIAVAIGVAWAFLPHLAWHTVLWGIESHSYFVLGFSLVALACLGAGGSSTGRLLGGLVAAVAAFLAMGPGALVPVALLGWIVLQALENRSWNFLKGRCFWTALGLLALAAALRVPVPQNEALKSVDWRQFFTAAARLLAWPHVGQPWAALVLNLPLVLLVVGRVRRVRPPAAGEDFVVRVALWSAAVALAAAWVRGGSGELLAGVPSRYVDFLVLLPLANGWAVVQLARETRARRPVFFTAGAAWAAFLFIGWLGLSMETWRGVIGPRLRDRSAPERLVREYQVSRNPAVFAGQPRLLIPHPDLDSVRAVLDDSRLQGSLPPSLQPERPLGPLSKVTRALLGR